MGLQRRSDIDRFLGHRIKQLRLVAGMTQQELAHQLRISHQQVHKYEKGIDRLSVGQLLNIAQCFDVPVADLFEGYDRGASLGPPLDLETTQMLLNVTRSFLQLAPKHQDALVRLARALAATEPGPTTEKRRMIAGLSESGYHISAT
jgi:transcriptional regulator with XRE-family HTH domain